MCYLHCKPFVFIRTVSYDLLICALFHPSDFRNLLTSEPLMETVQSWITKPKKGCHKLMDADLLWRLHLSAGLEKPSNTSWVVLCLRTRPLDTCSIPPFFSETEDPVCHSVTWCPFKSRTMLELMLVITPSPVAVTHFKRWTSLGLELKWFSEKSDGGRLNFFLSSCFVDCLFHS